MPVRIHKLHLPGELQQVRRACDFVVRMAKEAGLDEDGVFQAQLSVEEIFTNIIEHGYKYAGSAKSVDIVIEQHEDRLLITISDEAPPFDPLSLPTPDIEQLMYERDGGGWGVHFVRQVMDDVRYHYAQNRNHLTLEKNLV